LFVVLYLLDDSLGLSRRHAMTRIDLELAQQLLLERDPFSLIPGTWQPQAGREEAGTLSHTPRERDRTTPTVPPEQQIESGIAGIGS
jgi:hypothetical protein